MSMSKKYAQYVALAVVAFFALASSVRAASFDCQKAGTTIEKQICSDDYLSGLDDLLGSNYKKMMASNIGSGAQENLKSTQLQWLRSRNRCQDRQCLVNAYKVRIEEICAYPVISGMHPGCGTPEDYKHLDKNAQLATSQSQPSSAPTQSSPSASGLDFLYKSGGFWIDGEGRPGQACSGVVASASFAAAFKRFDPAQTLIVLRIGGQHPSKNDPAIAKNFNRTINIKTEYVVVSSSPNTRVKLTNHAPNGALIEEFYELRRSDNALVKYAAGACTRCDEAQLRVKQNFSGPRTMHWCTGSL